ncbi:hypothetical protein [Streptomyces sp. NPDC051310]|uniref:hypothetical protein n=1 Tax=Streptomyces sp. NPDC051310 TaxID=3365649 RepID=UPI0037A2683D
MTTTTDIARNHGYTGPIVCEDCGATESLHFGSWFDPETHESGDFLQCCACGIKAGDPFYIHDGCESTADEIEEDDPDEGPTVRVFHCEDGWTMGDSPMPEACTTNHQRQQDGRPACTAIAVWRVVVDHGLHLSIGFYCDADLPDEHRHLAA